MYQPAWDEIEKIYTFPWVDRETIKEFQKLKNSQQTHTKKEGALRHTCSFFLPYDKERGKIYLGWHIKADDWIPPGGHMEPGETPIETAIREMKEELDTDITRDMIEPWNLSVKPINQPLRGCVTHYDIWHLIHIPEQLFNYLKTEYHDAGWYTVNDGVAKITKNPDFAQIIATLI